MPRIRIITVHAQSQALVVSYQGLPQKYNQLNIAKLRASIDPVLLLLHVESRRGEGGTEGATDTGTHNFPCFPQDDSSLTGFLKYLQGIDGGEKFLKSAHEVTVDISKFLQLVVLFL